MKIMASKGGSPRDRHAIHFSFLTKAGLGMQRTIAIYFPSTNTLEVHPSGTKLLPGIMKSLRKYWEDKKQKQKLIKVKYW